MQGGQAGPNQHQRNTATWAWLGQTVKWKERPNEHEERDNVSARGGSEAKGGSAQAVPLTIRSRRRSKRHLAMLELTVMGGSPSHLGPRKWTGRSPSHWCNPPSPSGLLPIRVRNVKLTELGGVEPIPKRR